MMVSAILAVAIGLGEFSAEARSQLESKIRSALEIGRIHCTVDGAVTGVGDGAFFLQRDDDAIKVLLESGVMPKVGDVVEVSGSPILEGGHVLISASQWKRIGEETLPIPIRAGCNELISAVGAKGTRGVNWMRVEVEGRAIERTENGFAMEVDGIPITVLAREVPEFIDGCGHTRPKLRVRGVCEQMLDQSVLFGRMPYVMGVKLQLGSVEDVDLLVDVQYLMNVRDRRMMAAIVAVIALLAVGLVVFAVVIVRQQRRNFRTQTLMAERKRMADDIHDTIEQHLVGAGMLIQLGKNKEARDILLRAKSELRDIIWGLKNDDMVRMSPGQMIEDLAATETAKGLIKVTTKIAGLPLKMTAQRMRDLSLIVREAIGNAVKHGKAANVVIEGEGLGNGAWRIRIANDGVPFDAKNALGVGDGHFGLEGMRERARRIGARATIAVEGGRTVVTVETNKGGE